MTDPSPSRFYVGHTAGGEAVTALVLGAFRLHGALLDAGETLTNDLGLTSARWQVLSAVARAAQPAPVAHIAREMGLTRQAVQRVVHDLVRAELVTLDPNPHHRRASVVRLTAAGVTATAAVTKREVRWANALAEALEAHGHSAVALEATAAVVGALARRLAEGGDAQAVLRSASTGADRPS
jgi:DNA-binding MarR family transcriptional regulator